MISVFCFLPPPKSGSDLLLACLALIHQAKHLCNTGIYLIRQVAWSCDKNSETIVYRQNSNFTNSKK
jgi:hypothetical protein